MRARACENSFVLHKRISELATMYGYNFPNHFFEFFTHVNCENIIIVNYMISGLVHILDIIVYSKQMIELSKKCGILFFSLSFDEKISNNFSPNFEQERYVCP